MAAFVGRLISVGIFDGPITCLISLLRETLETPQILEMGEEGLISIEVLSGVLQQITYHARSSFVLLMYNYSYNKPSSSSNLYPELISLGELAIETGGIPLSVALGPERWDWIS